MPVAGNETPAPCAPPPFNPLPTRSKRGRQLRASERLKGCAYPCGDESYKLWHPDENQAPPQRAHKKKRATVGRVQQVKKSVCDNLSIFAVILSQLGALQLMLCWSPRCPAFWADSHMLTPATRAGLGATAARQTPRRRLEAPRTQRQDVRRARLPQRPLRFHAGVLKRSDSLLCHRILLRSDGLAA